jgi:hypothetical protein
MICIYFSLDPQKKIAVTLVSLEQVEKPDVRAPVICSAPPVMNGAAPVICSAAPIMNGAAPVICSAAPVMNGAAPVISSAVSVISSGMSDNNSAAPIISAAMIETGLSKRGGGLRRLEMNHMVMQFIGIWIAKMVLDLIFS